MPDIKKIIQKMKTQPNGIRFSEAEKVLEKNGYVFKRQKGSHRGYANAAGNFITLVYGSPVPKAYIEDILTLIGEK
ncbi:MAG: type II toxin-antitoxin system HicA family toxin [Synergistaceae bacterium]|jgi:predicted RNA binding protein YcfA (HicA-like mRNA interferase family)|nr:type II toxin-antitoxin system HicA family toxin [Synergistaceae bacterium]